MRQEKKRLILIDKEFEIRILFSVPFSTFGTQSAQRLRPLQRLTAARSRRALKGSTSTKAMNGGGSPWDSVSDDGGWGITWSSDKPVAPDKPFPLCTPCGPGPSQVSSSDFSTQLTGSVGSGGSGWGVTFQHTPVGQSDVATARSRSPRSFSNSSPFESVSHIRLVSSHAEERQFTYLLT